MTVTLQEAIKIIKANYPPKNYTMLRDAIDIIITTLDQQAMQIVALKNIAIEERARGNHYGMEYEDLAGNSFECWIINGEIDEPEFYINRMRSVAKRQMETEFEVIRT